MTKSSSSFSLGSCFISAYVRGLSGMISVIVTSSSSSIGSANFTTGSICGDNVRVKWRVVQYKFVLSLRSHIQQRFSSDRKTIIFTLYAFPNAARNKSEVDSLK